jgi:Na+/glutamate symporter
MNLEIALSYVILSFILFGWLVGIFETTSIHRKAAAESGGLAKFLAILIAIMAIVLELIAILNVGFKPIYLAITVLCCLVIYFYHFCFKEKVYILTSVFWGVTGAWWFIEFFY